MSSWFATLKESATAVANSAVKATESVVSHVHLDPDMLQKLTLSTPELQAERQRIDAEERRKEAVRDKLAGLLPWETRDAERDILVEECKQVILCLSSKPHTFTGPWEMPETNVKSGSSGTPTNSSNPEGKEDDEDDTTAAPAVPIVKATPKPTMESLEKLSKLEPLPNLLGVDFDLDSHVGLINRLLKLDPVLVQAQGNLSGGGDRERIFWHNYFFHCAYSRYEAGLSVDEVWSELDVQQRNTIDAEKKAEEKLQEKEAQRAMIQNVMNNVTKSVNMAVGGVGGGTKQTENSEQNDEDHEHEINFGDDNGSHKDDVAAADEEDEVEAALRELQQEEEQQANPPPKSSSPSSGSEYEMVDEADKVDTKDVAAKDDDDDEAAGDDNEDDNVDYEDPELDELEAEIARELED